MTARWNGQTVDLTLTSSDGQRSPGIRASGSRRVEREANTVSSTTHRSRCTPFSPQVQAIDPAFDRIATVWNGLPLVT
jgi:hypothetical protein